MTPATRKARRFREKFRDSGKEQFLRQAEFSLAQGESATLAGHTFTYEGFFEDDLPEKLRSAVIVDVDGQTLEPAIDRFKVSGRVIRDPETRSTFVEDVQVAVITLPEGEGPVIVRVTVQPLILWLWIGGLVFSIVPTAAVFISLGRMGIALSWPMEIFVNGVVCAGVAAAISGGALFAAVAQEPVSAPFPRNGSTVVS